MTERRQEFYRGGREIPIFLDPTHSSDGDGVRLVLEVHTARTDFTPRLVSTSDEGWEDGDVEDNQLDASVCGLWGYVRCVDVDEN